MYDVTNRESFNNVSRWLTEIDKYARENVDKLLVGNKADIGDIDRQVTKEFGNKFATEHNIPFLETSAKDGANVDTAFLTMANEIKNSMQYPGGKKGLGGGGAGSKGCC